MDCSELREERPSIIEQIVFYDKPGISGKEDFFNQRRNSQRVKWPQPMVKKEPEELTLKSELNIKSEEDGTEEDCNLIVDESDKFQENVVEILPSDVSDNTKITKLDKRVEIISNRRSNQQKGLKVYGRKTPKILEQVSVENHDKISQKDVPKKTNEKEAEDTRGQPPKAVKKVENKTKMTAKRKASVSSEITVLYPESPMKKKQVEEKVESPKKNKERRKQVLVARLEPLHAVDCDTESYNFVEDAADESEADKEFKSQPERILDSENEANLSKKSVNIISVQYLKTDEDRINDIVKQYSGPKKLAVVDKEKSGDSGLKLKVNPMIFERANNQSPQKSPPIKQSPQKSTKNENLTTDGDEFNIIPENEEVDYVVYPESGGEHEDEWIPIEDVDAKQIPSATVYRCEQCKDDFLTKDDLTSHIDESRHVSSLENEVMLTTTGGKVQKAKIQNEADIEEIEDDERPEWIPEDYAEYKLKHSASKKRSFRVHKCKICLSIFKSYYLLCKHRVVHLTKRNPYECRQCDANFEDIDAFTAHIRMHQGKNPYPCKKCEMGFMTKDLLEEHSRIHILKKNPPKVKRFRCDICGKEFSKLCDMERHTRVHTGEKPAECNICHKRFQQTHNLSKHLLTHLQVKPFQCDICNKKFGRIDVLNRHLLTHSLDKPFKCILCPKGFIRLVQYQSHMGKSHPGVEYAESETETLKTEGMKKSQAEDQSDPDNDLEIQENRVDIVPVDEMEPDVPDEVDLNRDFPEDGRETEMEGDSCYDDTKNIRIIRVEESTDNREIGQSLRRTAKTVFADKVKEEYFETPQNAAKNSSKLIIHHIDEFPREQNPNDPNAIMERILNPQEDIREQIIDEIN